jgi:hypothetical protein
MQATTKVKFVSEASLTMTIRITLYVSYALATTSTKMKKQVSTFAADHIACKCLSILRNLCSNTMS